MTTLHQGEDSLTSYTFGNKNGIHRFCKVCGTSVLIFAPEGVDGMGVNVSLPQERSGSNVLIQSRFAVSRVLILTSWSISSTMVGIRV